MARSRNLKPSFFLDDELAELNPLTRILFCGLWCVADRVGRLRDRPKRIKAEVLPYDDYDVDSALSALVNSGHILRYAVDNVAYIQIVNFEKHQRPHIKETASTIPEQASTGNSRAKTPDSLNLIPDSLNLDSLNPITTSRKPRFAEWWDVYDKKVDRKKCEMKWGRLKWEKLGIEPDDLIADALNRHANCAKWPQYQSNPLTYLNGEKWDDEIQQQHQSELTEDEKHGLRKQRTAAILQELNGSPVGDNDPALPPPMDSIEWGDRR